MPIKRSSFEIDDSPSRPKSTTIPDNVRGKKKTTEFKSPEITRLPSQEEKEGTTQSPEGDRTKLGTIGRTYPDLFFEYINEPKAIITFLFFVPFPFFAGNVKAFGDLLFPSTVGLLLNVIWFGVHWLTHPKK